MSFCMCLSLNTQNGYRVGEAWRLPRSPWGCKGLTTRYAFPDVLKGAVFTFSPQLPIYPVPEPEVVLVETPSELEKQISVARRAVTATYDDAHSRIQAVVPRWIGVEQAVERTSSLPFFAFLP